MKKLVMLTAMLAGVLALGFSQTDNSWAVNNTASWIAAVNGIRNGGNDKAYTITVSGTFSIPSSTESTFGALTGITVTMEGSGTVSLSTNGALLRIGTKQTLVVRDITLLGRDGNNNSVVRIDDNRSVGVKFGDAGTFRMEGSAKVMGNTARTSTTAMIGGGVYVGKGGTFTMRDNASVGNTASYNGGAQVYIGEAGTFTMRDNASVSGNTDGRGVYNTGTFTMQGGTISGNTARRNGGGVSNDNSGTFTMWDNASVSGNTATDNGGGVYNNIGVFTMEGGTISDNNASKGSGGGVYNRYERDRWGGTFSMKGGTISGNTASYGGGVYVSSGTFTKTGGTIHGSDAEQKLRNTAASRKGYVVYDANSRNWRNATADSTMNSASYGFWLNDEVELTLPSNFMGTWKRANFNNTLTFTEKTVKISSSSYTYDLLDISGDSYTLQRSGGKPFTLAVNLTNGSLVISGDSGTGQDNWNGTWRKQ